MKEAAVGLDVGNSRVKIHRLPRERARSRPSSEWVDGCETRIVEGPDDSVVEHVVALEPTRVHLVSVDRERARALADALARRGVETRGWRTDDVPLAHPYEDGASLGPDRIVAALAACWLADGPAIIVDCGTAVTVDVADPERGFLGGAIAPGYAVLARALAREGAMLPLVETEGAVPRYPGHSTAQAIRLGVEAAFSGAVLRLVTFARRDMPAAPVFVTGGDAERAAAVLDGDVRPESRLLHVALALLEHGVDVTA